MNSPVDSVNLIKIQMDNFERNLNTLIEQNKMTPDKNSDDNGKVSKDLSGQISFLCSLFESFKGIVSTHLASIDLKLERHDERMDELESYSRRNCLLIHGVSEDSTRESCVPAVLNVFNDNLQVPINASQIDRTHRIGRPNTTRARPIIVKFVSYEQRHAVFGAKTLLKASGISISESLTRARLELLKTAKVKFGMRNVWSMDSRIKIKYNNKVYSITTLSQLQKIPVLEQNDGDCGSSMSDEIDPALRNVTVHRGNRKRNSRKSKGKGGKKK